MPLAFLAPLFLIGLAAVAVPIWVHLRHREKGEPIDFPSLMFLLRVPHRSERRQRIRNWPLFLLRVLALALLAFAFARPFVSKETAVTPGVAAAKDLVLLLDVSHSMRAGDRWTRARAAADSVLGAMRPGDRGTLILFDREARRAGGPTNNAAELRAALNDARPGDASTNFTVAIEAAQQALAESSMPRRVVHVVSDFQRTGLHADESARLPRGTELEWSNVTTRSWSNRFVSGVTVRRETRDGRPVGIVGARVVSRAVGDQQARAQTVSATLTVEGREMSRASATIPASGAATITFAAVPLPPNDVRAEIRLAADPLPQDDTYRFVLARSAALPVTIVERGGSGGNGGEATLYLRRALGIGEDPAFDVAVSNASAIRLPARNRGVVMLIDVAPASSEGAKLLEFVRGGGGLVISAGQRLNARDWLTSAAELLPATLAGTVDRLDDRGATIASVEIAHALFAPFAASAGAEFATARFWRYRDAKPPSDDQVLARFDDGAPALIEKQVGAGRVLLWNAPLDNSWSDFPVRAVFLPFVHQAARYASGYSSERAAFLVGDRVAGRRGPVALDTAGFYAIAANDRGREVERLVSANVDAAESDLAALDPRELAAAVLPAPDETGSGRAGSNTQGNATAADREARQSVWWYLVAAALLALVVEMVIAARTAPVRAERIDAPAGDDGVARAA